MSKFTLIKKEDDISIIMMEKKHEFIVWFFGHHHELLKGDVSACLDRCSHRTFTSQDAFKEDILQPLLVDGWDQLKNYTT